MRHGFQPDRIAADGLYGTGAFLAWLLNREVTPHIPVLDRKHQTKGKHDLSHFQYDPERDSYTCFGGHQLKLCNADENTRVKQYRPTAKICGDCPVRKACTDAPLRTITRQMDEVARQTVRNLRHTQAYDVSHDDAKGRDVVCPFETAPPPKAPLTQRPKWFRAEDLNRPSHYQPKKLPLTAMTARWESSA